MYIGLGIIGKRPCNNFAVQYWINDQIRKLPKGHEVKDIHLEVTLDPARHFIILTLLLKSETKDGNDKLERRKNWKIDYDEVEKFYRDIEEREGKSFRKERNGTNR